MKYDNSAKFWNQIWHLSQHNCIVLTQQQFDDDKMVATAVAASSVYCSLDIKVCHFEKVV